MKEENKIQHPFLIPDNFHEQFKSDIIGFIESEETNLMKSEKIKKISFMLLKYAAVVAIAFTIGRYSVPHTSEKNKSTNLEIIYNQVNEDDIIDFIIEDDLITEI